MLDSRRTWLRRIGTIGGLAAVVLGLYTALIRTTYSCRPSTPQHQLACDPGPPSHPHLVVGLLIAAVGLAVIVGARRVFAYFAED